ncbi:DUF3150 domain-containing protein [Pseudomonas luteola]|uniref:Protein of uncharacterized function (DUF3150) n=1 Tax=Pseudomonas luteola TaxID=47886 RepID=A0A2X2C3Z8_PSELU|nr:MULTISPECIES: DUF3150 domain-containing protein [Pseudomonas]SHJ71487.1 Protein of unknown function [Pseudomonas zeshuii]SPZ00246.1 Protein of uncharacterised function (DUF3150) [Pseudomonas luteola]
MTVDKALLQELVVVNADYDIWSGQVRLEDKDIKLGEGGELPPDRVAQLGNKTICDPASLKVFRSLRGATRRMLEGYGLPFLTGWAVPRSKLSEILGKLETARLTFEQEKQAFLGNYDSSIQNWIANNVGYEEAIRNGVLDRSSVEKRLKFDYQVFHIQPVSGEPNAEKRLADQTKGLAGQLFREIETEADEFYQKYLRGKAEISVRTRKRLECLADKVDGLSFLNRAFEPVVRLLRETVDGYDQHADHGPIGAPFFFQIHSVVTILCDQVKMKDFADGNIAAQPDDDAFDIDVPLQLPMAAKGKFPSIVNGTRARVRTGRLGSREILWSQPFDAELYVQHDAKGQVCELALKDVVFAFFDPRQHAETPSLLVAEDYALEILEILPEAVPTAAESSASAPLVPGQDKPVQQSFDLDELLHDMDSFFDRAVKKPAVPAPVDSAVVSPTVASPLSESSVKVASQPVTQAQPSNAPAFEMPELEDNYYL